MKKVAVISTIIALYRYEISNLLSKQDKNKYDFYTSIKTHSGIKTVDFKKSKLSPILGGIRWKEVKNLYIRNICVWQNGVFKVGISKRYSSLILLGNMYCLSTWVNALMGRLTSKHVLMWTHGLKGGDSKIQLFFRLIFYRLAHDLLVYEKRGKQLLIEKGFKDENVHIIYNSLDYSFHFKLRNQLKPKILIDTKTELFDNNFPTIVYSGRLVSSKKVNLLIESILLIQKENFDINCLIIGDGPEMNQLKNLAQKESIKNIVFYGSCYDEKRLSRLIGMSDLMVSPGNIGLAVVHAFSFGTPVISHCNLIRQMPEIEIIENEITGILFEENNIEDLKDKILLWLNDFGKQREEIRKKCYINVDKYYNPNYQVKVFNTIIERGIIK